MGQPIPFFHPDHGSGFFLPADAPDYRPAQEDRKPPPLKYTDRRAVLFFPGLRRLVHRSEFTGTDYRVLWAIVLTSDYTETDFPVNIPEIQKLAGLTTDTSVHRSIRKFTDLGLLHRTGRGRLSFDWSFLWRNGSTSREIAKRRAQKAAEQ